MESHRLSLPRVQKGRSPVSWFSKQEFYSFNLSGGILGVWGEAEKKGAKTFFGRTKSGQGLFLEEKKRAQNFF